MFSYKELLSWGKSLGYTSCKRNWFNVRMITDERESQVYPGSANDTARETVLNHSVGYSRFWIARCKRY